MSPNVDRPAAIRQALRSLVAERGFHGASMGAVAKEAGVATGTAYVHYESKEELVYATYLEVKDQLAAEVVGAIDPEAPVFERYRQLWMGIYDHLAREPERARFLTQMEESPYYATAHQMVLDRGDRLVELATAPEFVEVLAPLPMDVVYQLTMGVAVRMVASGIKLTDDELESVVGATWRAVTRAG